MFAHSVIGFGRSMKKFRSCIENFSCKAVCIITAIILAAFTYWAGIYTHLLNIDLVNLKVRLYEDQISHNIICFFLVLVFFWGISKFTLTRDEIKNKKRVHMLAILAAGFAGIVSVKWAILHPYMPDHDQLQVVADAMDFIEGNYTDLKGYLEIFPYQTSLVFLYKILLSIWDNLEIIYVFHSFWIMVIVYFSYAVAEELFENSRVSLFSIILAALFVPMYFYVNYAYGDLCMASCGVLGIWFFVKFSKNLQTGFAIALLITMTISYMARTNSLIVMLAMGMAFIVSGMCHKKWKSLIMAVLVLLVPLMSQKTVINYYEHRANVEMLKGSPAILSVAMGMQDTYEGPGYYNAYNLTVYVNAEKDSDEAAEIGKKYILDRLDEMAHDLTYTQNFYKVKIWQQWNEPSFGGEVSTNTFDGEINKLVENIYYGQGQDWLRIFRNYYMFVLYASVLVTALCKMFRKKDDERIWENIVFIIFIGGFLFSLLWESKSRYVMPYVVMLIPCGAYGLYKLQYIAEHFLEQMKNKAFKRK